MIKEFENEIFTLVPCWMCSPESASAIFPMQEIFDLVIFDEASQCYSEKGIPAMYRGKQVVITGDSMQLQPTDLYNVRYEDEEDENPQLTIDSLLELSQYYLPSFTLLGHYRSKSLELIDFSNQYFYGGKLKVLPDFEHTKDSIPAIDFIKTNGIWEEGINQIEALEVTQQVICILKIHPNKTIGIVTFNHKQQSFIQDVLEEEAHKYKIELPRTLFIKNIENVQGDEREIILFSIAYAPDSYGKVRLQFGSLNQRGGEKRLNVAVTRAKEKIIIISSLMPHQLKIEDTQNEGPKRLKDYLTYAIKVKEKKWVPNTPKYETHHVDWSLANKLGTQPLAQEIQILKKWPFADLLLKTNGEEVGLILTDDDMYFQALNSKEIYGFQHFHLKNKNWKYIRIYSRDFWMNREEIEKRILHLSN